MEDFIWGTGRRKKAVAGVRIRKGEGKFFVNKKEFDEYFKTEPLRNIVLQPLIVTKNLKKFDVLVNVKGGGISGQAGAVVLGLSRALVKVDESLVDDLKAYGLLTRDPRMTERKKYGHKGARKSFQFSKR